MAVPKRPETSLTPVRVEARILEVLPKGLFRAGIGSEGGGASLQVHLAAGSAALRIRPGDRVEVELMPYDSSRGRIVKKHA